MSYFLWLRISLLLLIRTHSSLKWVNGWTDIWKCLLNDMWFYIKNTCVEVMTNREISLHCLNYQIIVILTHWDLACQGRHLHDTEARGPLWLSVSIICLYLFTFALMRLFAYLCVLNLLASISIARTLLSMIFIFLHKKRLLNCCSVVWFAVVHTLIAQPYCCFSVTWI